MKVKISLGLLVSGKLGLLIAKKLLAENEDISFIATDMNSEEIIELADENDIPLYVGNPRKAAIDEFLVDKGIDVLLSVNYLFLIKQNLILLPKKYAINLHGSLLPKYRGRTPHVWAIINNEKLTGITAHLITNECDAGDILEQIDIPILENETGNDILIKFNKEYLVLVDTVLTKIRNNTLNAKTQNHELATFYGKRIPEDGVINWSWQKERIRNWVRAQTHPYPGAFSFINGRKVTIDKISFSELGYNFYDADGKVLAINPKITVKTPNGAILLDSYREKELDFNVGDILGQ